MSAGPDADRAVARLVDAFGGRADEPAAAAISVLVQAAAATPTLILHALRHPDVEAPLEDLLLEVLRHDSPVVGTRRVGAGGHGEPVELDFAAGNRDVAVFATPDAFRPGREAATRHLTFGTGRHACPGASLALSIAAGAVVGLTRNPNCTRS